uniref:hypothetical protein n=1 Tax=Thaumasiovibrio occultus TaxID=1891184 RepID=UPI000B34FB97|nr:hypothetical protein [Thaumasiovibrio occultus]
MTELQICGALLVSGLAFFKLNRVARHRKRNYAIFALIAVISLIGAFYFLVPGFQVPPNAKTPFTSHYFPTFVMACVFTAVGFSSNAIARRLPWSNKLYAYLPYYGLAFGFISFILFVTATVISLS